MRTTLLFSLVSLPAWAALTVTGMVTDKGTTLRAQQFYQGDSFRVDMRKPGATTDEVSLIYLGRARKFQIVTPAQKSYLEITETDMQRMLGLMMGINRPKTSPTDPGTLTFKAEGTRQVSKWSCTEHAVLTDGKKTGTVCVVPYTSVGAKASDLLPIVSAAKSVDAFSKFGRVNVSLPPESLKKVLDLGFPVDFKGFDSQGKVQASFVLESIVAGGGLEKHFVPPAGYKRSELMSLLNSVLTKKKK